MNIQKIIAHFFNHLCTKRTLFVQCHSMWLDTASSKLKRMIGCKVLMDWKATVKDTENFWTCKEYMLHQKAFFVQSVCHTTIKRGSHSSALLVCGLPFFCCDLGSLTARASFWQAESIFVDIQ